MAKRKPVDQHARERADERYGAKWGDRACREVLELIRSCRWVPFELQGTRIRALLKYHDEFFHIVFETSDLSLVTALPLNEERMTPEQFERVRKIFPELANYGDSRPKMAQELPTAVFPVAQPLPAAPPSFFMAAVLPRFGRDKNKALAWWNTPNYQLSAKSPAELEAGGHLVKVITFLERAKREKWPLLIPQRRDTASLGCKQCRGYPPPELICRCEDL